MSHLADEETQKLIKEETKKLDEVRDRIIKSVNEERDASKSEFSKLNETSKELEKQYDTFKKPTTPQKNYNGKKWIAISLVGIAIVVIIKSLT